MSDEERDFLDEYADEDTTESTDEADTGTDETDEKTEGETGDKPESDGDNPTETDEKTEAPPATDTQKDGHVPIAALLAERDKRQKFEQRIAEYERKEKEQQDNETKPDIWENPDAYIQSHIEKVRHESNERLYAALEAQAREVHPDYDEVFKEVQEHAKTNPGVGQQILSSPNPAQAAYTLGKKLRELKQMDDPDAYKAKIKAEARAEFEAEMKAKEDARKKTADAIPPDLSGARSVSGDEALPPEDAFDSVF